MSRLCLVALLLVPALAAAAEKPNVVFLLADDLGYGDLGCFGGTGIRTPHIDRLAAEGTRFTQCYAGDTVCAPSRCALITGKHTGHTPVRGNREVQPEGNAPLPLGTVTLPGVMKAAGYATGAFGKWGLGGPGSTGVPGKMGVDRFYGYLCQRKAHEYYPEYLWRNDEKVMLDGKAYSHDLIADEALKFVRDHRDRPFFLYVPFTIPHGKLQVPDLGEYADRPWPEVLKTYASMVSRMDRDVGRLMALLKELKLDDKTLVFFASDNGWERHYFRPDHVETAERTFGSRGPFRAYKTTMYEGGLRTPMIARWPGRVPAGKVSDQVWAFWDVLPTCAELAGATPPADGDGISMVPALTGKPQRSHEYLYWENHAAGSMQAVRFGDWKAVKVGVSKPTELYDLKADVGETKDLAAERPDLVRKAEALMKAAHTPDPAWPLKDAPPPRPAKAKS